jgi:hypothetical protein
MGIATVSVVLDQIEDGASARLAGVLFDGEINDRKVVICTMPLARQSTLCVGGHRGSQQAGDDDDVFTEACHVSYLRFWLGA